MDSKSTTKALHFDGNNYQEWKKVVEIWKKATSITPDKQGPYLILQMSGKAISVAVDLEDVSIDNLLKKLEEVFGDTNTLLTKYEEFEDLKRPQDQPMREFVHNFEKVQYHTHFELQILFFLFPVVI